MSDSSDIDDSSFHSLDGSKSSDETFEATLSCRSDSESEDAQQSTEVHTSYRTLASSSEVNNTLQSTIYNTTTDTHETSMECGDEISVVSQSQKQKKAKKWSNWHTGSGNMCPRKLPPVSYVLPSVEAFSLDPSKFTLKESTVAGPSKQCEAEQKILYTGNWVDSQQVRPKGKLSPLKQFELVLAAYQKNKEASTSTSDHPKETSSMQQAVSSNQSKPVEAKEEEEEYVSPFKDMPIQEHPKESPLLAGLKKPLVLPAGYDLSSLEVIKNPNHWSLRPGLRTGDRI